MGSCGQGWCCSTRTQTPERRGKFFDELGRSFVAEVWTIDGSDRHIAATYQPVIYCHNIRQAASLRLLAEYSPKALRSPPRDLAFSSLPRPDPPVLLLSGPTPIPIQSDQAPSADPTQLPLSIPKPFQAPEPKPPLPPQTAAPPKDSQPEKLPEKDHTKDMQESVERGYTTAKEQAKDAPKEATAREGQQQTTGLLKVPEEPDETKGGKMKTSRSVSDMMVVEEETKDTSKILISKRRTRLLFKFLYNPEHMEVGGSIVIADTSLQAYGEVISLCNDI